MVCVKMTIVCVNIIRIYSQKRQRLSSVCANVLTCIMKYAAAFIILHNKQTELFICTS